MKKTILRIALVAMLVLAMALPMVMSPAMASEVVNYKYQLNEALDASSYPEGTKLSDTTLVGSYNGAAPALSTVAYDPKDPGNKVLKLEFAPADDTTPGSYGDYIYYSGIKLITWDDATKESGTITVGNTNHYVYSKDGGKNCYVDADTATYYPVRSSKAEYELNAGGSNVDKNLVLPLTEGITNETIVVEADYFISSNANGSLAAQFPTTDSTWNSMFDINLTVAQLGFGSSQTAELEKDAWSRISIVWDLSNDKRDFYVNGVYVGSKAATGQAVTTGTRWIVAKVAKGESYTLESIGGYVMIDNANIHTLYSSEVVNASTYTGENLLSATITTPKGHISNIMGKQALVTPGVEVKTEYLNETYTKGLLGTNLQKDVSIRLTNTGGIRFATNINTTVLSKLTALKEGGYVKDVTVGTMIAPLDYVTGVGTFTHKAFKDEGKAYLDVGGKVGTWYESVNLTPDDGFDKIFVGSILNIKEGNRSRDFAAVGYVKVTTLGGEERYIYSYDYTSEEETSYDSIHSVARKLCLDDNGEYTGYYQKLNADTKALMDSFINGKTSDGDYGTNLQTVEYTSHEFFFTNKEDVAVRFTFDGTDGWRLQAVKSTGGKDRYNHFDDIGAGQALAKYLGEKYSDITLALTVHNNDDEDFIELTAGEGNPYVRIYKEQSRIEFCSADGEVRQNITSIVADTEKDTVTMMGDLATGEAIYGGGERFDAMNRRGSSMWLNISDAYNGGRGGNRLNPDTFTYTATYVAIPLFTTTRGAGMYINRYEVMTVDFDTATYDDQWCVVLDNNLMDCYFWATGEMSDALDGYTKLTGAAALPEEWAQGVMVCRYSPDFKALASETFYNNLTDIPNYTTLKLKNGTLAVNAGSFTEGDYLYSGSTCAYRYQDGGFYRTSPKGNLGGYGVEEIVMDMIGAGMTPTAVILEPANILNITNGTMEAQKNYQNLVEMIEWIHSERENVVWEGKTLNKPAMKAMVYIAVADMSSTLPGYKSEYWLHAKVYDDTNGYSYLTHQVPRRDTENPDAQGADSQSYLDITNPEAVEWYMNTVWSYLIDLDVDGVKIDFCENVLDEGTYADLTVRAGAIKQDGTVTTADQQVTNGRLEYLPYNDSILEGDEIHHAYPTFFISMFYKAANELMDQKQLPNDFIVFSRGGGIGSQRNPYMWSGDNTREFSTLSMQLRAILSSGVSGLPFMTADMAGYAYLFGTSWGSDMEGNKFYVAETGEILTSKNAVRVWEGEVFTRALQYMAFTTNIQMHGDVLMVQDFTTQVQGISKLYTDLHNDLLWYIQKVSEEACDTGMPAVRHMVLNYQGDANVYDLDDQFMLGDGILVAPILESTADWTYSTANQDYYVDSDGNFAGTRWSWGLTQKSGEVYLDYEGKVVGIVGVEGAEKTAARISTYYADLVDQQGSDASIDKTMTRDVYLPAGKWVNALTGEVIDSNGETVEVTVAFNQIPVFINANSEDAQSLIKVFNGDAWQEINGGKKFGYTITFVDYDGEVISEKVYAEGETVVIPSAPTRAEDNTYTYTFAGWDKDVSLTPTADVTYTATYTETYRDYTVTFVDENGTELATGTYHYGDLLTTPTAPTKASDETYDYAFAGWGDGYTGVCNGTATYTATYTQTYIEYTVTFYDDKGVIETKTLKYGDTITPPAAPTKESDEMYDYVFTGWHKTVPATCDGDAEFTAVYEAFYNSTYDPVGDDIFPEL